ncbi:MAG TPA: DUF202 domain-containing protein [Methanocella sp.]|nr:DUF202 domain-containing protein [Methanocella sp.]
MTENPPAEPPDLSYDRTRMAADRTLMAGTRTTVSMISFGFSIYKFFQYLRESDVLGQFPGTGPRLIGEALVILGTALMGLAIAEYIVYLRWLSRRAGQQFPVSTTLIGALAITFIGLLILLNLFWRVWP